VSFPLKLSVNFVLITEVRKIAKLSTMNWGDGTYFHCP